MREAGLERVLETGIEYTAQDALDDTLAQHRICWIPDAVLPRAVEKFFSEEQAHWRAYDDARATLVNLRARGLRLALLSNATDQAFKSAAGRLDVNAEIAAAAPGSPIARSVAAISELLERAQIAEQIRGDLTLADLGVLLAAVPGAGVAPEQRARFVDIVIAGLAAPP